MRIQPATNRDFADFRHGFFPFRKLDPHLRWPQIAPGGGKMQGLAVRSLDDSLVGLCIFEISEKTLFVSEFTTFPLSRSIGAILANGLRNIARQNGLDRIWFSDDQGHHTQAFIAECGFELMAFFGQRNDFRGGRTNLWRLPHEAVMGEQAPWRGVG
jgi:hypothetical protein